MSNKLKEPMKQSIYTLLKQGKHSRREISRILGVDRKTVNRYARIFAQNGPKVPTGYSDPNGPQVPTGFSASKSNCAPYHDQIVKWLEKDGLSARRIYQDLVADYDFQGGYDSVKRYVSVKRQLEIPLTTIKNTRGTANSFVFFNLLF